VNAKNENILDLFLR